jgi:hypothetical protein
MKSRNALVLATLTVAILAIPKAALAQQPPDLTCNTQYIFGTYHNVTAESGCSLIEVQVTGNLTVVQGGSCNCIEVQVTGNLTVMQGGSLFDVGSTIGGNLQANQPLWIVVFGLGQIGGSLQVTGTTSEFLGSSPNLICSTSVVGDVQIQNNSAASPFAVGGTECPYGPLSIGGNLQVQNNAAFIDMGTTASYGFNPFCNIFGLGNQVCGNIEVHNNTGRGVLANNQAMGNCQLNNDVPPFLVDSNSAGPGKTNDCNTPN